MTFGERAVERVEVRRVGHGGGLLPWSVSDGRLEAALHHMTNDELRRLQATLYEILRSGLPTAAQIAKTVEGQSNGVAAWLRNRETRDDTVKVVMLLAAVAVAIAWWTHRAKPAPLGSIEHVIDCVDSGHCYLLPIPRSEPCFCGSGAKFKCCHGRPPLAAPLMSA